MIYVICFLRELSDDIILMSDDSYPFADFYVCHLAFFFDCIDKATLRYQKNQQILEKKEPFGNPRRAKVPFLIFRQQDSVFLDYLPDGQPSGLLLALIEN